MSNDAMAEPFNPEDIPVADFGTDDEVRGWNLCRRYVIEMIKGAPQPVIPAKNEATP